MSWGKAGGDGGGGGGVETGLYLSITRPHLPQKCKR